jgi:hypothetical protein
MFGIVEHVQDETRIGDKVNRLENNSEDSHYAKANPLQRDLNHSSGHLHTVSERLVQVSCTLG